MPPTALSPSLPLRPSFRGTPASSSARLFTTLVGQSLEIRIPLGPRRPFQVRHYPSGHQRRSQRET